VYRWIDSHEALLKEYKVRVMDFHGDESCWTGGLRAAAAMNMGTAAGTTDWVVVFGDEDCVFRKDWDVALWEVIKDRDFMRFVSTPVMVMPRVHDEMTAPVPARRVTAEWIHAQRNRCCHQLTYPILAKHGELNSGRIYQETFESFAKTASLSGVHEESCGERRMCHWVPLIMHKQLFNKMGGYPTTDRAACSFDLVLDDTLRDMGVRKRMPLDHPMLHAKHFFRTNDEVDRVWGDKELLTTLGQEEV
jgi:hypothetical protein